MPTIKQLPLATRVAATDELPLSQGSLTRSAKVGLLLAGTQPSITLAPGALLGRVSASVGGPEPEPVAVGVGLAVSGVGLAATGADHLAFPATPGLLVGDEVVINSGSAPRRMPATALRRLFSAGVGVQIDSGGVISAPSGGGLGTPGLQGIQGDTGAPGPQGSLGPSGAAGATGVIGLRGLPGAQGPAGLKGDTGAAGAAAPVITDASALQVIAGGAATARSLGARAADRVNARDFGAALNDSTDDTAALMAARAAAGEGAVTLPSGVARVTTATEGLSGRMDGDGQIRTADGHKRAPRFSLRSAAPTSYGNQGDIVQAFDGDLSTVHLAIEHRIEGDDTLTKPATSYVMHHENSAISLSMLNQSGWNQATDNQVGGRTGVAAINSNVGNVGQGDAYFLHVSGFVAGTKPGSTHFLANPALVAFSGDIFSFADGTYQEVDEFSHDDGGFGAVGSDIAVSSTVRNFNRTNNGGAKGAWWLAFRLQSLGTKAVDVALQPTGKWNNVIDTTPVASGPTKAVWTQAAGQRTYLNASAFPDGFSNPAKVSVGTTYTHYNPVSAAYEVVVGGTTALSVSSGGVLGITPAPGSNDATLATTAFVVARVAGGVGSTGPAGPAGAAGTTGLQGPIGATGASGSTGFTGAAGAAGVAGPQGLTGTTGAAGPTGIAGAVGQGFSARGAWVASTSYAPYDVVTYGGQTYLALTAFTSGTTFNAIAWNLWAAAGATGPAGNVGAIGATGAQGPIGATGSTGAAGATGIQGTQGILGAAGATGTPGAASTVPGPTGGAGAAGTAGATGATGPAGPTTAATSSVIGAVKPGVGLAVAGDGTLSAVSGSAYLNGALQGGTANALPRLDIFTAAGSYTWTKLAGAALVDITLIGAGGGGGAGGVFAAATAGSGGAGGGAGAVVRMTVPAALVAATVTGVVAANGAGGVGGTATGTGANGTAASAITTFPPLNAYGGNGGNGGVVGAGSTGGGGGGPNGVNGVGLTGSQASVAALGVGPGDGAGTNGGAGFAGRDGILGGAGSGAAGTGVSTSAAFGGGIGGTVPGAAAVAAAVGGAGLAANAPPYNYSPGAAGGSGGSAVGGASAGSAGAGSGYGSGGSGAGSCVAGGTAGSGAAGTPGLVMVVQR